MIMEESLLERYELALERIRDIQREAELSEPLLSYFQSVSKWIIKLSTIFERSLKGDTKRLTLDELKTENRELYEDIIPDNYGKSYANPDFITCVFEKAGLDEAKEHAKYLCFIYAEMRGLIPACYEAKSEIVVIYLELFIEIYTLYRMAAIDNEDIANSDINLPLIKSLKEAIYYFESDNCDVVVPDRMADQLDPSRDFATKIIMEEELNSGRYLYLYGEYITEDEIKTAKYLSTLPEEDIKSMADTFTEGYRIGFVKAGKPLNRKKTVNIRYSLGFERITRYAIDNFRNMGLEPVIYRAATLSLNKRGIHKIGYQGANPNRQYDFDHKDDEALFIDGDYVTRKIEVMKDSYEQMKELANTHAGPAVQEVFGEEPFTPVSKENAISYSDKARKLSVDYAARSSELTNEYIIGEERSFTIIAYPMPSIGKDYEAIFKETVKLNTLDYKLYENMQQKIIDVLDRADTVHIKGKGDNRTDLVVALWDVKDKEKETKFENCVADVNIPVGEVFTSPKLKGTNGVLHVTGVYLNELFFENLELTIKDGMIEKYSVTNFDDDAANLKFVKDNLLFNHESLPIGEFAIGTNTVAYKMTRDYKIADKLPILIGEKTGPHFAFGDTCYSHEEEVKVYNPDGKEIIAKENEVSKKRNTDPKNAYFQCHTDVTIPYDELGEITAISEGFKEVIFADGGFKVEGCDELNKPLKE